LSVTKDKPSPWSNNQTPVTREFFGDVLEGVGSGLAKLVREHIDRAMAEVRAEMERRLEGLPHDAGVHEHGKRYRKGALVTSGGSAFLAQCDTDAPIGGDPPSKEWRMFCQRGRDGRR
jgi:hypothetical protein